MSSVHSVTGLRRGSVDEDIKTFFRKFESKHTQKNYERSIRNFFMWYRNKSLEMLNVDDLKVRNADILNYRNFLKEHEADYAHVTINNYIAAIQSLYEFLEINEYNVNSKYVKVDPLSDDGEHAGALYLDEAERMAKLVHSDRKQGQEKSAFIRMAYTTSFRKSSLRNLEWTDIKFNSNGGFYDVYIVGKGGKKHVMPISIDLYNELLKIKERPYYKKYGDNKIFHLSNTTIQNMMDTLKEKMGIPPERNIVFHSLRNVAASFGSLEEAKKHLNHSNISTTEKSYRHINEDRSDSLSLRIEEKIDDAVFEMLTREELLELILKQSYGVKAQLMRDAKSIIEKVK